MPFERTMGGVIPPMTVPRGTGMGIPATGAPSQPSFSGNLYNPDQGFNLNYLQPWLNNLQIPPITPYPNAGNQLNSFFGNQFPFQLPGQINQNANQFAPLLQQIMQQYGSFSGGFQPAMFGNLNYLNQYGLPGNQQVQQEQKNLSGTAQGLLDPLSKFLTGMISGGGLTPEYVAAQRRLVLDPARQDLMGNLNKMAGGQAELSSPAFQELLRRQEGDFADRLLSQGFQNLQGFSNLAGGISNNLYDQSLQRFGTGGTLGLQNLQTIQGLANNPLQQALQLGQFGQQGQQNLLQTMLPALLQFYQSQGQLGLGANQIPENILRTMIGGQYDLTRQQALIDAQNSAARWGAVGNAIPGIAGILGQIFNRGGGSNTGTQTGRPGSTGTPPFVGGAPGGGGTGSNQLTYIPGVGLVWTGGGQGGFGPWDGFGINPWEAYNNG